MKKPNITKRKKKKKSYAGMFPQTTLDPRPFFGLLEERK
jgi:hypothetical protein